MGRAVQPTRNLPSRWRLLQLLAGVPVAAAVLAWAIGLLVAPEWAMDVGRTSTSDPRRLLPMVLALGVVLWVEGRLARAKASAPPQST